MGVRETFQSKPGGVDRPEHLGAYVRGWLRDPYGVASLVPSGRSIARLMAAGIQPDARVLELGAGTGALTEAILGCGVSGSNLVALEQNTEFVRILRQRFPQITVLEADATALSEQVVAQPGSFDFVICGLPVLWFSRERKQRVLQDSFAVLREGGELHQITYWGFAPVGRGLLSELGLRAELIGIAALNLPPAFAYRFVREERRRSPR